MDGLTLFTSKEVFKVRIVMRDGEPWFVAKDVCDILGLANVTRALESLDDDEKITLESGEFSGVTLTNSKGHSGEGGARFLNIVSEPGLYRLIFKSRKPVAKAFKRWVTHEVLPSIRKTGSYIVPGRVYPKAVIDTAGKTFFMDCYRKGGIDSYLERRYPDDYNDPRQRGRVKNLLTRQEKRWLEEAESAAFLAKEGRL
jgi:prophage antirepressor-like protein